MSDENMQADLSAESSPDWMTPVEPNHMDSSIHYHHLTAPMHTYMAHSHAQSHMMVSSLLQTVHECASICEHTITLLLCKPDVSMRFHQIQMLRDCAGICAETSRSLAEHGPFTRKTVKLCAKICEACGRHCLQFPDPESQRCGHMCLKCAYECRMFVSTSWH